MESPDATVRQAIRILAADPELAGQHRELLERVITTNLASTDDLVQLRNLKKAIRTRIIQVRHQAPRRKPQWKTWDFRRLVEMAGSEVVFWRDITRSSPEKNGIYKLSINFSGAPTIAVTLTQPNNSSLVWYSNRRESGQRGNVTYIPRLSRMMITSMLRSKECVSTFFGMGSFSDWTSEKIQAHLRGHATWKPSQKISAYGRDFLQKTPIYTTLRQSLPPTTDDDTIIWMVKEALLRESPLR